VFVELRGRRREQDLTGVLGRQELGGADPELPRLLRGDHRDNPGVAGVGELRHAVGAYAPGVGDR
jgi:hypothetical protein